MDLDDETKRLLIGALTYHPEFLDIWKAMNDGEPDSFTEMSSSAVNPDGRRQRQIDEALDDD